MSQVLSSSARQEIVGVEARKLERPVTLKEIKADPALAEMELLTKFRLSVSKVTEAEWNHIRKLAGEA